MSIEKIENWILMTLDGGISPYGLDPTVLYHQIKPPYLEISEQDFHCLLKIMEKKGWVVKSKLQVPYIQVSKTGINELKKRLNDLKNKNEEEYIVLLESSPFYKLKERISILENVIVWSFLFAIGGLGLYFTGKSNWTLIIKLILFSVFGILMVVMSFLATSNWVISFLFFRENFVPGNFFKRLSKIVFFIEKNRKFVMVLLITATTLWIIRNQLSLDNKTSIFLSVVLGGLEFILNYIFKRE